MGARLKLYLLPLDSAIALTRAARCWYLDILWS